MNTLKVFSILSLLGVFTICLQAQIPTEGLILYYPFNGNSIDESVNEFDATVNGAILTTDRFGNENKAYEFDGYDDNIYFSDINKVIFNSQDDYTICGWFNPDDLTSSAQDLFNTYPHRVADLSFRHWMFSDKFTQYFVGDGQNWDFYHYGEKLDYEVNTWYFFTFIKSGTNFKLYINAILDDESNIPESNNYNKDVTGFFLGSISWNSQYFKGKLDDYRIYNRALNECEIGELYNEFVEVPSLSITVDPLITVSPGGEERTIYKGYGTQEITLTASGGSTYEWTSDQGGFYSSSESIEVSPDVTTIYTVVATNEYGCQTSESVEIFVIDANCGNNNSKLVVCHNGREICIALSAVTEHLDHGDNIGLCRELKRSLPSIDDISDNYLKQNQPNPFSNTTVIEYGMIEAGKVKISLFDYLGNELSCLLNEFKSAGTHTLTFENKSLPVGSYIYQLQVNGMVLSKVMIIIE